MVSFSQSQTDDAFYVYRNDGVFNAFFYSEVDSITYSFFDKDSNECTTPVTQEIWTSDSIYRIPLNVIDSVSFVKPKTSYKANVIKLDDRYIPYILSSDNLSICFKQDLPKSLIPRKDDILLYEGFCDTFPDGFAGRVVSVSDEINVKCDSVEFEDIYDELILFGDYVLTTSSKESGYRLIPSKIAGEIPSYITVPLNYSVGPISIDGSLTQGVKVRIIIRLQNGLSPFIEFQVKDDMIGKVDITVLENVSDFRQIGNKVFGISVPIPECPAIKFEYAISPFVKPELDAGTSYGYEWSSKGQTSYVYNGDKWQYIQKPRINEQNIIAKTSFIGSIWYGIVESIHIGTIKNFLSVGTDIYIGPKISGNIDIENGLTSMYDRLKDSKIDLSLRFESDIVSRWRLSKKNFGYVPLFNIVPGVELIINERYLFPSFTKPDYNLFNTNVELFSEVSRSLLFPCSVGFRISNKDEIVDTYYDDRTYLNDDDFSAPLSTVFTGLKYDCNYRVCPMVEVLGLEFEATPFIDFDYGVYVTTGGANAAFTEAQCWGGVSANNSFINNIISVVDECGFFYNTTGAPINGNAIKQLCSVDSEGLFDTTLSDLTENTQYYYTAYVRIGKEYLYGDIKTFKTKKSEVPDPDPDPDPEPELEPVAITGTHYDETSTMATIECEYQNVPTEADCGYYLYAQKDTILIANVSKSFGCVNGIKIVNLSDLIPATTYYYQAYIQYNGKEYLGDENSFQTLTPDAVTGGCYNITSNKATVVCSYYNLPPNATTGLKLSYNEEVDELIYNYGEGEHLIDINNLFPGTTYTYSAYIKYENNYYEGTAYKFTTLIPSAYVNAATNIKEESAQFEYGFYNVPIGGTCHIFLQSEEGDELYYSVSNTENDIFQMAGLQPSTTYTYWAYINYYGNIWESNKKSFTTLSPPIPSAITGKALDITETSATIECTYQNVPDGAACGVEYTWNEGSIRRNIGTGDGLQIIPLSGLERATTYTYCAYIEADGQTYYGNDKSFTTKSPDLTGWWTFNDAQGDGGRVHRVEFYADGTTNAFYGVNRLAWNISGRNIIIKWYSGGGSTVWWEYRGRFNEDFSIATGDAFYCVFNDVTGYYWEDKSDYQFSLSR